MVTKEEGQKKLRVDQGVTFAKVAVEGSVIFQRLLERVPSVRMTFEIESEAEKCGDQESFHVSSDGGPKTLVS